MPLINGPTCHPDKWTPDKRFGTHKVSRSVSLYFPLIPFPLLRAAASSAACAGGVAFVSTVGVSFYRCAGPAASALTVGTFLYAVTDSVVEIPVDSWGGDQTYPFVGLLTKNNGAIIQDLFKGYG
jgi:hypothetical protein